MSQDPKVTSPEVLATFYNRPSSAEALGWELAELTRAIMAASLSPNPLGAISDACTALGNVVDELRRLPADVNMRDGIVHARECLSIWSERGLEINPIAGAAMEGGRYLLELSRQDNYAAARRSKAEDRFVSALRRAVKT